MPIVAIAHPKGGAGKTTTAFNVVAELKPDKIIDLDILCALTVINSLRDDDKKLPIVICKSVPELIAEVEASGNNLVFIDCGGFDSDLTRTAVAIADIVIVPSNDTLTERIGLSLFDQMLAEISEDMNSHITAHLLLCKTHHAKKNFPKMDEILNSSKHLKRLNSIIPHRTPHTEGLEIGQGVTETLAGRHSPAGKDIISLVNEIRSMLANISN